MSGNIKVSVNSVNSRKPRKKNEVIVDQPELLEPVVPDKKKDSIFLKTMNNLMSE